MKRSKRDPNTLLAISRLNKNNETKSKTNKFDMAPFSFFILDGWDKVYSSSNQGTKEKK